MCLDWTWEHYAQNPSVTLLRLQLAGGQFSLAGTLYLQVFEGLLRHEFLLLVPFHSVHYTGPQKSNHCRFWKIIPFHFFFNIENHLHFTKKGVKRGTGRWGDPPVSGLISKRLEADKYCCSVPPFLAYALKFQGRGEHNGVFSERIYFSLLINRLSSGQELLGNENNSESWFLRVSLLQAGPLLSPAGQGLFKPVWLSGV